LRGCRTRGWAYPGSTKVVWVRNAGRGGWDVGADTDGAIEVAAFAVAIAGSRAADVLRRDSGRAKVSHVCACACAVVALGLAYGGTAVIARHTVGVGDAAFAVVALGAVAVDARGRLAACSDGTGASIGV